MLPLVRLPKKNTITQTINNQNTDTTKSSRLDQKAQDIMLGLVRSWGPTIPANPMNTLPHSRRKRDSPSESRRRYDKTRLEQAAFFDSLKSRTGSRPKESH